MKPYFLSICAVVKNEGKYIAEFVAFHKLQGVEHFYLYDNGSTDNTIEILLSLQDKGVATVLLWPKVQPIQLRAYQHCLEQHRKDSDYIAFIDVDEFLYSAHHEDLKNYIRSILYFTNYNIGAIAAHWLLFGSNGETEEKPELVIERFTSRDFQMNLHVKSIVCTDHTISTGKDPHTFYFLDKFVAVNDDGRALPKDYALSNTRARNYLRINHYHTKSKAEYFERKKLGDPQTLTVHSPERIEEMFQAHDKNEVKDTYLKDKYSVLIREMIQKELL